MCIYIYIYIYPKGFAPCRRPPTYWWLIDCWLIAWLIDWWNWLVWFDLIWLIDRLMIYWCKTDHVYWMYIFCVAFYLIAPRSPLDPLFFLRCESRVSVLWLRWHTHSKIPENQLGIMAFLFTLFFVVFMILFDDAKSVALYSAYVDAPQHTRKSYRNYGLFYLIF